ncbi:DUF2378 family protein [bacterium]|nr:DUF2378 family protein [bacterium]
MDHYRGVGIVFLRNFIKAHGSTIEEKFIQGLNEEQNSIFLDASNNNWVPVPATEKLFEQAARLLYPGDQNAYRHLGRERAKENFSGIYKSLLKITTIAFIIKRAAKVWEASYEKGHARVEKNKDENRAIFIVEDYPEFSPVMMEVGCGYIEGVVGLSSAENIQVNKDVSDPQAWKWHITWD